MKSFNKIRIIAYCFSFLLVATITGCSQTEERPPNIVLIMADDMGYECIGANGCTEYTTPNLDRLASSGIRFDNCYSQPLCTPSRVKIMTGKFNYRNYEDFGYLNPKEVTFGNILKDAGYVTCISGKWQLNGLNRNNPDNQDVSRPYHFGFDEYCLWQLHHKNKKGQGRFADALITQNGEDLPRDPEMYGPRVFADYIIDFIDRKADEPFFVYYPMVLVHDPFVPTPDSPEWSEKEKRFKNDTTYFADMMAYTDRIIGELEAKLKEEKIWDNTLFIFTADNGTHRTIYTNTRNGVVKGAKGENINTGNHVPFIVSWPKGMKANRAVSANVSFADVLPTLCEVAGVDPSTYTTDGHSILPLIKGEQESVQDEVFIHYAPRWGKWGKYHNRWIMDGNYKLYRDGRFYNTQNDPLEKVPLKPEELNSGEKSTISRFQTILDEKEQDIPFDLNDKEYKVKL